MKTNDSSEAPEKGGCSKTQYFLRVTEVKHYEW